MARQKKSPATPDLDRQGALLGVPLLDRPGKSPAIPHVKMALHKTSLSEKKCSDLKSKIADLDETKTQLKLQNTLVM